MKCIPIVSEVFYDEYRAKYRFTFTLPTISDGTLEFIARVTQKKGYVVGGGGKAILFGRGAFCLQIAWRRVPALPRLESPRDKAAAATRR